jgi:hypothetical protein
MITERATFFIALLHVVGLPDNSAALRNRQPILLHRLDRTPDVIAALVLDAGRRRLNVAV